MGLAGKSEVKILCGKIRLPEKRRLRFPYPELLLYLGLFLLTGACDSSEKHTEKKTTLPAKVTPVIPYELKQKFPHDTTLFTEGLIFNGGKLYESTGSPESQPQTFSVFGELDLHTGKLIRKGELDKKIYFGEGIVFLGQNLYQLTYTNQVCFMYDAGSFQKKGQFSYPNKEGWGMTTDGKHIIFSDGTDVLTYLDPGSCSVSKELAVTENGFSVMYLNELEFIRGYLYANVWMSNSIVKIDTASGKVVGRLELDKLFNEARSAYPRSLEMNGIAYDSNKDMILVTGKLWPYVFEISFPH
jgi:glutamine cyclotransferase